MNTVLLNHLGHECFVYLDDIVIFEKCLKDHNDKVNNKNLLRTSQTQFKIIAR